MFKNTETLDFTLSHFDFCSLHIYCCEVKFRAVLWFYVCLCINDHSFALGLAVASMSMVLVHLSQDFLFDSIFDLSLLVSGY